jgi:hypothetical protein
MNEYRFVFVKKKIDKATNMCANIANLGCFKNGHMIVHE